MLLHDFNSKEVPKETFYDLREDWALIESSFRAQYGVRLRVEKDMPWTEFCSLLSGLMPDTPLGSIVSIRAESDPDVIKRFTSDQKKIRSDWNAKRSEKIAETNPEYYKQMMDDLSKALAVAFGPKAGGETNAS